MRISSRSGHSLQLGKGKNVTVLLGTSTNSILVRQATLRQYKQPNLSHRGHLINPSHDSSSRSPIVKSTRSGIAIFHGLLQRHPSLFSNKACTFYKISQYILDKRINRDFLSKYYTIHRLLWSSSFGRIHLCELLA